MFHEELKSLANRVVNQCLAVKSGERVLIDSVDLDDYSLPEFLVDECAKVGAFPVMLVTPREFTKVKLLAWNSDKIKEVPKPIRQIFENVDIRISVYDIYMPTWRKSIPENNLAAFNQYHQELSNIIMNRKIRNINISVPTMASVNERGLDFNVIFADFLKETNIDYIQMGALGDRIKTILQQASELCVETSDSSLVLNSKGREYLIEDGIIDADNIKQGFPYAEIPAGEVFTAPNEHSANGEVVFPDIPDYGEIKLTFKEGKVISISGKSSEKFQKRLDESTGDKDMIAEFAIGLNPGSGPESEKALGSIHIAIGKNNHLGGVNESSLHWDLIIPKPTLKVDGKLLIDKGSIVV